MPKTGCQKIGLLTCPAAKAAAEPPEEPPAVKRVSHGFRVLPNTLLAQAIVMLTADQMQCSAQAGGLHSMLLDRYCRQVQQLAAKAGIKGVAMNFRHIFVI